MGAHLAPRVPATAIRLMASRDVSSVLRQKIPDGGQERNESCGAALRGNVDARQVESAIGMCHRVTESRRAHEPIGHASQMAHNRPALPTPGRRAPARIRSVSINNRRKGFSVGIGGNTFWYPYARLEEQPLNGDKIVKVMIDPEVAREAFVYTLSDGREGEVHTGAILDYHKDPRLVRELLLYQLSIEAQKRVESSRLSKRELAFRLTAAIASAGRQRGRRRRLRRGAVRWAV